MVLSIQKEMLIGCMYQGRMEVGPTYKLWGVCERWVKQFWVVCEEFLGCFTARGTGEGILKVRKLSVKLIEDILEQWAETRQLEGKKAACSILGGIPGTTYVRKLGRSWLRKADSKIQTEALICAGQEQAQRTNHLTDTMLTLPRESRLCR